MQIDSTIDPMFAYSILFVSCHYLRNTTYVARPARHARMLGGSPLDFLKLFETTETFDSYHCSAFRKTGTRTMPACALCDRRWPVSAGQTILAEVEDARPFKNRALDTCSERSPPLEPFEARTPELAAAGTVRSPHARTMPVSARQDTQAKTGATGLFKNARAGPFENRTQDITSSESPRRLSCPLLPTPDLSFEHRATEQYRARNPARTEALATLPAIARQDGPRRRGNTASKRSPRRSQTKQRSRGAGSRGSLDFYGAGLESCGACVESASPASSPALASPAPASTASAARAAAPASRRWQGWWRQLQVHRAALPLHRRRWLDRSARLQHRRHRPDRVQRRRPRDPRRRWPGQRRRHRVPHRGSGQRRRLRIPRLRPG